MSYVINKTNGDVLTTLYDGTLNTDTGLTLIGRNYPTYGEIQNENFIRLLENFADALPPGQSIGFTPITGQLWWDTANRRLKVYDDEYGEFLNVSDQYAAATSVGINAKTGDQWYNTTAKQLFVHDGTQWQLIGPIYSVAQGTSGPVVTTINDYLAAPHLAVQHYSAGNLIAISSSDPEYQPLLPPPGFGNIAPGINLKNGTTLNGTANNSIAVGGISYDKLARTDVNTTFNQNISVNGVVNFTNANVYYSNNGLILQNKASNGNVEIYTNSLTLGNVTALRIDGATGLLHVNDPVSAKGVATKGYVDTAITATTEYIDANFNQINGNVSALYADYIANVNVINSTYTYQINNLQTYVDSSISGLSTSVDNRFISVNAAILVNSVDISNIYSAVALRANIASPVFTGAPTAPNAAPNTNSNVIATTAYVEQSALTLTTDYISRLATAATTTATNLTNGLALKANIDSPALTGTPTSVTPPAGDNSTRISTTAFVQSSIETNKFNYSVATTAPGDINGLISSTNNASGNNGDFWFQIG